MWVHFFVNVCRRFVIFLGDTLPNFFQKNGSHLDDTTKDFIRVSKRGGRIPRTCCAKGRSRQSHLLSVFTMW